jgi:mono/diheme cytochrome c family protein
MNKKARSLVGLVAAVSLTMSGCRDAAGYDLDVLFGYIPIFSTMRGTVSYQPYQLPRLPAPGSVPLSSPLQDELPPFTQLQLDSVGAVLMNPIPASAEVLARGQVVYERQCSVCHGVLGDGAGSVVGAGRFPAAVSVRDAATAGRADGYLYGVIRVGRGLMPAYGERISHPDRWAVVHYMRQLQGGVASPPVVAPAGDIPLQDTTPDRPVEAPTTDTAAPVAGQ